jgi:AraC-like DNA-binding protein
MLLPGEAIWFAPGAPMRESWDSRAQFFGMVLRPSFLRFLVGISHGDGRHPGTTPFAFHVKSPLAEPSTLLAAALDRLSAGKGDAEAAPELMRALLRCASMHAQTVVAQPGGKAAATWQRVQEWIAERAHGTVDRDQAASALGLHPSYLSDLCREHSGHGFAAAVQAVRLARAQRLLLSEPGLSIQVLAQRCGFTSAGYFNRVFRVATGVSPHRWRQQSQPVLG